MAGKEVAQVDTLLSGVLGGGRVTGASSTHRLENTVEGLHSLYSGLVGRTSQAERQLNALELQAGQLAVALEDARRAVDELEAKMGAQQRGLLRAPGAQGAARGAEASRAAGRRSFAHDRPGGLPPAEA